MEITNIEKLKEALAKFDNILVVFSEVHDFDDLAAGLSVGLSLEKFGKKTTIFSPRLPLVEQASLFGISKITNKLNSGNLIIAIPNALNSVDKITHYLDGETLNIVVHPVFEGPQISTENIKVLKADNLANLVLLINTPVASLLDKLNTQEQELYSEIPKFIISKSFTSTGNEILISTVDRSSLSETVVFLLNQLGLPIDSDCASNLFQGMKFATGFEPPKAKAATFEAASICLAKKPVFPQMVSNFSQFETAQPQPVVNQNLAKVQPKSELSKTSQKGNLPDLTDDAGKIQSDWLVPKIFKSSSKPDKT